MKKAPKQAPESTPLAELLQKHAIETKLLQTQNQDLHKRITQQISQNHHLRQANNSLQEQNQKLQRDLAKKQKQILMLQAQKSNLLSNNNQCTNQEHHEVYAGLRDAYEKMIENDKVIQSLSQELRRSEMAREDIERSFRNSKEKSLGIDDELRTIQDHCNELKRQSMKLKEEADQYYMEIESLKEECQKTESKYKQYKRKYKEVDGVLSQKEIKYKQLMTEKELEIERCQQDLAKQKQAYDKIWREVTAKNTTIQFQKLQLAKNQQLLSNQRAEDEEETVEREQKQAELEIRCSSLTADNLRLIGQVESLGDEMRNMREDLRVMMLSYDSAYKGLKESVVKELERKVGNIVSPEEIFLKFERIFEQVKVNSSKEGVIQRLKQRQRELEDELKAAKSKSKSNPSNKNDENLKLQNQLILKLSQIKLLETQIIELKESTELNVMKVVDQRNKIEQLSKKLQKESQQSKKKEDAYTIEMKKCLNELYQYKNKVGQLKGNEKEEHQFRETVAGKIGTYEKKIKDLLENLDRKEELLGKFKQSKKENEALVESLYEKLGKAGEFEDLVKKYKQDLARKDELVGNYKQKYEGAKNQYEGLREAFEKMGKQASNIERELERKTTYINTMKEKFGKEMAEIQKKLKNNSQHTKSISNVMENKLISIKKQCLNYEETLEDLKKSFQEVIEQLKEKQLEGEEKKSKKKKKENIQAQGIIKSAKDWEATKVLGLKQSDLQQFINPQEKKASRKGYQQKEKELERLWTRGEVLEYFQASIAHIVEILNV